MSGHEQTATTDGSDEQKRRTILARRTPEFEKFAATQQYATALKGLKPAEGDFVVSELKQKFTNNPDLVKQCLSVFNIPVNQFPAGHAYEWILTMFYDMLREDASCSDIFEAEFKANGHSSFNHLASFVLVQSLADVDEYIKRKSLWLLTALVAAMPANFSECELLRNSANGFLPLEAILRENGNLFSKTAKLEALSNLLKCNWLRKEIWAKPATSDLLFNSVQPTDSSQELYRFVFNIWMLSFDADITLTGARSLKDAGVVPKLKSILVTCRSEKVVRLSLVVLKNLLRHKELCRELVQNQCLDVVQQLEYEKWRDTELYDALREVSQLIATEQSEISNFDTYRSELETGKLTWGFIHTYKFWAENYKLFDGSNYDAVKKLAALLADRGADATTLAVACHDVGEFVSLHPGGKKVISDLGVKEHVMRLMQKEGESQDDRQVRREALLCCQKIMLNKWQEAAAAKGA